LPKVLKVQVSDTMNDAQRSVAGKNAVFANTSIKNL